MFNRNLLLAAFIALMLSTRIGWAEPVSLSEDNSGFAVLTDVAPDVVLEIRYYSTYNFVGERIAGYEEPCALLTKEAAQALKSVSDELAAKGYRLKVYDAYRPHEAVRHFVRWSRDARNVAMKEYFYPDLDKSDLFPKGYIAEKSGHSRGSTVDLTLLDMKTGKELDMGGTFDFFGEVSHSGYAKLSPSQLKNRKLLRDAMMKHGFKPLREEWWHFTLKNEPYPNTYFTFPVRHYGKKCEPLPVERVASLNSARNAAQIILVGGTGGSAALFGFYEKRGNQWRQILAAPAHIGKNGLGKTREGDGKTPVGVYRFTQAFGIAPDPGSRMDYTQVNDEHYWVGDSSSHLYNKLATVHDAASFDAKESEHIVEYVKPYQYCLNINYNEEGKPGKGSAIFLHCYSDNGHTGGCVAIPENDMRTILRKVNKETIVIIDDIERLENY